MRLKSLYVTMNQLEQEQLAEAATCNSVHNQAAVRVDAGCDIFETLLQAQVDVN